MTEHPPTEDPPTEDPPTSGGAAAVVAAIAEALAAVRNPDRAEPMAAYMKHQFPFLGVAAADRRRAVRAALRSVPAPTAETRDEVCRRLWDRAEREYQYCVAEYLSAHLDLGDPRRTLALVEELITSKSWWDTVDELCRKSGGELVHRNPALRAVMERWLASDDIWLIRSAILHQERWGPDIEFSWLRHAALRHAEHREFFVRKAIGWTLRTYAHRSATNAQQVRELLTEAPFSGLTRREALTRVPW